MQFANREDGPSIIKSPFIIGSIVKEKTSFWGRDRELDFLLERIEKKESTSIIGPRRIGKSSLAYQVFQDVNRDDFLPIWIDGQMGKVSTLNGFLEEISKQAKFFFLGSDDILESLIEFEESIEALPKIPIIFINEFEIFTEDRHSSQFNLPFYNTMRTLAELGKIVLILVSQEPIRELCKNILGISSPFYNIFESLELTQFTNEETQTFLRYHEAHGNIQKSDIEFIEHQIQDYQHPFILQIACDSIYRSKQVNLVSKNNLKETIQSRVDGFLNHKEVKKSRSAKKKSDDPSHNRNKVLLFIFFLLTLFVIVVVPVLSFSLRDLNFSIALLVVLGIIFLYLILGAFVARFMGIIGESTFNELYKRLIDKLSIFSDIFKISMGKSITEEDED